MLRRLTAAILSVVAIATLTFSPAIAAGPVPQELRKIEQEVAAVRGLKPTEAVNGQLLTREEWRQRVRQSAGEVGPQAAEELSTGQRLLVLLGYVAPGARSILETTAAVRENTVEGFYESRTKTMNVILNGPRPRLNDRLTYAHEFVHALQDQHYGIRELNQLAERNNDKSMAILSLIEGDATLSMVLWARQHLTQAEYSQLAQGPSEAEIAASGQRNLPLIFQRSMAFPYNEGALFVASLWRQGGFEAVDAAFANPPLSTAEILHPERYLAGYGPVDASFPRVDRELSGGPWFETQRDTMGELDLRVLLEQFGDPVTAERASTGWAGDAYSFMTNAAEEDLLLLRTIWDDAAEAAEFAQAFADSIGVRYDQATTTDESVRDTLTIDTVEGSITIHVAANDVYIAVGPNAAVTAEAVGAIAPARALRPAA